MARKIRVIVVDDSAFIRNVLTKGLSEDSGIEVVASAPDPYVARDKIVELKPDVLTLDVEMPRMDGLEFLRKLMPQYPIPVVVVSSLTQKGTKTALEALELGAVDVVAKPASGKLMDTIVELRTRVKIASTANVSGWKNKQNGHLSGSNLKTKSLAESTDKVIAIGGSTGGTEAIKKVLMDFPVNTPGVVIVQHMPPGFTKMYADRLNQLCVIEVKEAQTGDRVLSGRALIAPGGFHMRVRRSGGIYEVECFNNGELVNGHRPSVDVLMYSVAEHVGSNAIGAILTGMGNDGAKGLLAMRKAGARTVAQDEATSVVFGMPKVAYEEGGAERLKPLDDIAYTIISYLQAG